MDAYVFSDRLFGDEIVITVFGMYPEMADMISQDAYHEALRLQKIFNIYDKGSEISHLNRKRSLKCSSELVIVLQKALHFARNTDGLYDPTLGKLFLARKGQGPQANPDCSYREIEISGNRVKLLHEDVYLDLGSIAKGYIVDKVVEYLKERGAESGIVDGRGDIRAFGCNATVDIQHPRDMDKIIASVSISDQAVATSGDYNQYMGSYKTPHILNSNRFSSVTVIASTLEEADLLATVISVKGDPAGLLGKSKNLKVVAIGKDLRKKYYNIK